MKKVLVSMLVLALCAPAMAATIDVVGGTDGTAVVTITADGAANIVGLGLDVDVDAGAVTAVEILTPNFNVYPDAGYTLGASFNPWGDAAAQGTPVCDKTAPGEVALSDSFALCFANLNGEDVAGADGAASVQVKITVSEACNLTVCENATRAGIVAVDGTQLEAACDTDAITVGASYPACWDWPSQCYSDVTNNSSCAIDELNSLVDGFGFDVPSQKYLDNVCLDGNRDGSIAIDELNALITYFGLGLPTDCVPGNPNNIVFP